MNTQGKVALGILGSGLVLTTVILATRKVSAAGTATLSGTVTDSESGTPIPGVTVDIQGVNTGNSGSTQTDTNGNYSFSGVEPDSYEIMFTESNYQTGGPLSIILTPGQVLTKNEAMVPLAAELKGVVTDAVTGLPLSGVAVKVGTATATTDTDGYYDIVNIPEGTYTVTFTKTGYTTITL
jgi:protocatechuate 3,4-dioxygenase beta subunit